MLGQFSANAMFLLAQAQPAAGAPQPISPWANFLPFAPLLFFFYIFIIRPQQQQERKRKEMIEAVGRGDEVLTGAGIYGTVVSVDKENDRVVLRVSGDDDNKGTKITFSRSSIVRVFEAGASKKKDKEKASEIA